MTVAFSLMPLLASAQDTPALDRAQRQALIDKTIEHVNANYIYPERARAVEAVLRDNARRGKYDAMATPDDFLAALNTDMQSAGQDKHLRVIYSPPMAAQLRRAAAGGADVSPEYVEMLRGNNFQLRKAESLDGNVGYLKFDGFVELRHVRDGLVGAMNFLQGSSALIIDLTENGGGASESAELLLSYFLPAGTRIGESWHRKTKQTTVSTVQLPGDVKPRLDLPLYVLVSNRTASAAEFVAYTLQQAKRAVIVGSRTKGMANAGEHFLLAEEYFVMVPTILGRNSVSGTNWEGVGIAPDVVAEPASALDAAMERALMGLAQTETNEKERYRLRFLAERFTALVSPQPPPAALLEAVLGEYEDGQRILSRDGALHYVKGGSVDRRIRYMRDGTFTVDGRSDYRLRFPLDAGRVTRFEVLWFDNTSDTYRRTR